MSSETVKVCSCGKPYTREQWNELKALPMWDMGLEYRLELRNCECGSTMGLEVYERDHSDNS